MKFLFHNDTAFNKLSKYVSDTWKCLRRGEGEEEIANHGWSRVKSFSQETGAIGQQGHGVTKLSRGLTLKSQVQDAQDSPTPLPFFFSSFLAMTDAMMKEGREFSALRTVLALFGVRLRSQLIASMASFLFSFFHMLRNLIRELSAFLHHRSLLNAWVKMGSGVLLGVVGFCGVARAEFVQLHDEKPALNQAQVAGSASPSRADAAALQAAAQGTGSVAQGAVQNSQAANQQVDRSKFKALPSRFMGKPVQKNADEKLHEVSDMYEKHFLREMLKAMRSTVHETGFIQQNQAEKIFREQLDDQYVDRWSEKGGIGLSKLIYEQLIDKFGVQMGIKKPVSKPQGPLPLDEKSQYTAHQFHHPGKKESLSYRIVKNAPPHQVEGVAIPQTAQDKGEVKSPWDGVLLGIRTLADKQTMLEIEHDNGLKSQVVFKGELTKISTGEKIQAGETLGVLSAEAKSLYWTVEKDKEPGPETVSE